MHILTVRNRLRTCPGTYSWIIVLDRLRILIQSNPLALGPCERVLCPPRPTDIHIRLKEDHSARRGEGTWSEPLNWVVEPDKLPWRRSIRTTGFAGWQTFISHNSLEWKWYRAFQQYDLFYSYDLVPWINLVLHQWHFDLNGLILIQNRQILASFVYGLSILY